MLLNPINDEDIQSTKSELFQQAEQQGHEQAAVDGITWPVQQNWG